MFFIYPLMNACVNPEYSDKFEAIFAKITNIPVYEVKIGIFLFDLYLVYQL